MLWMKSKAIPRGVETTVRWLLPKARGKKKKKKTREGCLDGVAEAIHFVHRFVSVLVCVRALLALAIAGPFQLKVRCMA